MIHEEEGYTMDVVILHTKEAYYPFGAVDDIGPRAETFDHEFLMEMRWLLEAILRN